MSRAGTDGRDDTEHAERVQPADAFVLIGNETRLSVLEALWSAEEGPVQCAALNEAAGLRDNARFNISTGRGVSLLNERPDGSE